MNNEMNDALQCHLGEVPVTTNEWFGNVRPTGRAKWHLHSWLEKETAAQRAPRPQWHPNIGTFLGKVG